MYPFDSTFIILIPAILLAMYAQFKVNSTFKRYSEVTNRRGLTAADVAAKILEISGVRDVSIEHIRGNLTDHYDPRDNVVRLSDAVYNSRSIAAIGIAAHEIGHVLQHHFGYAPISIRNSILPVASVGSQAAIPLFFIGLLLSMRAGSSLGYTLMMTGVILFALVLLFQVVTLPVEFNASRRALELLAEHDLLAGDELVPAKNVLSAAALTYVAAVAVTAANLLRFLMILSGGRGRR